MAKTTKITHERLVQVAKQWLRDSKGCRVVATELATTDTSEVPDVIGWGPHGQSVVVECKVSRADFRADQKKMRDGVGRVKWYLTPPDLIKKEEVPEGWGLAEFRPSRRRRGHYVRMSYCVRVIVPPSKEKTANDFGAFRRLRAENTMLISIAWRALRALELVGRLGVGDGAEGEESLVLRDHPGDCPGEP